MANATSIHQRLVQANGSIAQPAADVLDTGTADVAFTQTYGAATAHTIFEVTNTAAADLTVEAIDDVIGTVLSQVIAEDETYLLGPFGRRDVATSEGDQFQLVFTPDSGTIGAEIRAYQLPRTV